MIDLPRFELACPTGFWFAHVAAAAWQERRTLLVDVATSDTPSVVVLLWTLFFSGMVAVVVVDSVLTVAFPVTPLIGTSIVNTTNNTQQTLSR
jgi:hypothetical protein